MAASPRRVWSAWARVALVAGVVLVQPLAQPLAQAQSPTPAQAASPAGPLPPARAALCSACHGGLGSAPIQGSPSLAAQPRIFLENTLVLIREGLREVPAMKGLLDGMSDAEIVELSVYFAKLPAPISDATIHLGSRARGADLSKRNLCGTCHERDYRGREQVPRLAGQSEGFLLSTMRLFRGGVAPGRDTTMVAIMREMSDADLVDLAHYFATAGRANP